MRPLPNLTCACLTICACLPVRAQIYPVPIPGGDIYKTAGGPEVFVTQFLPGPEPTFDGVNAEPHGIINSRGIVAQGLTAGKATDNKGQAYDVIADFRVYQGTYIGATPKGGAGGSVSARAHGTFVEI
jgi:hypothetical protein